MDKLSAFVLLCVLNILFANNQHFSQAGDSLFLDLGPEEQFLCPGESFSLLPVTNGTVTGWSTGETTQSIQVTLAGTYSVTVTNGISQMADTVELVENGEAPIVDIDGSDLMCAGDTITLTAVTNAAFVLWSTGAGGDSILVDEAAFYAVTAVNACGDSAEADISIFPLPDPEVDIFVSGDLRCPHDQVSLIADFQIGFHLNWSTGANENTISVSEPGMYWVDRNS